MSFENREKFWAALLYGISIVNLLFSIVILGLSVGTVQNSVFSLGRWTFLEPLWEVACADIAAAAFIFTTSVATCVIVAKRTKTLVLINAWGSGLLVAFNLALGISTLVLAEEKNPALRQLTVFVCLYQDWINPNYPISLTNFSIWGQSNGTLFYNRVTHTWVASDSKINEEVDDNLARMVPFGLDIFKWKSVPKGYNDCDYFDDLMTPCGALLIIVAIIYIFKLLVAYKLYTKIGKDDARRHTRFNIARQPK